MYVNRTQTGKGIFEIFQLVHIKKGCRVPPVFPGRPVDINHPVTKLFFCFAKLIGQRPFIQFPLQII